MNQLWSLPVTTCIEGCRYDLHTDYRDILEIFTCLEDPELPEFMRWQVALGLFYVQPVLPEHRQAAMAYLAEFIRCGNREQGNGPKLMDWQQDAPAIIADINRVSGQEIRGLKHVHWWTFLSWFHAIGEGQLSGLVSIRDKLRRGKKLEDWEREFYRENRERIDLKPRRSPEEEARRQEILDMLK